MKMNSYTAATANTTDRNGMSAALAADGDTTQTQTMYV